MAPILLQYLGMRRLWWVIFFGLWLWSSGVWAVDLFFYDDLEPVILERVNSFRKDPWQEAEVLGLNREEISHLWPAEDLSRWSEGLSPLSWNPLLAQMAQNFLQELLEDLRWEHLSREEWGPEERAQQLGYEPLLLGESLAILFFENYLSPERALSLLLEGLFQDALKRKSLEGAPFLFPPYQELGAALAGGQIFLEGQGFNFYALCLEFGLSVGEAPNYLLVGRVFQKVDGFRIPVKDSRLLILDPDHHVLRRSFNYPDGSFYFEITQEGPILLIARAPEGDHLVKRFFVFGLKPTRVDLEFLWDGQI